MFSVLLIMFDKDYWQDVYLEILIYLLHKRFSVIGSTIGVSSIAREGIDIV